MYVMNMDCMHRKKLVDKEEYALDNNLYRIVMLNVKVELIAEVVNQEVLLYVMKIN